MGNLCGKPPAIKDSENSSSKERKMMRGASELLAPGGVSSRRDDSFRVKKKFHSGEMKFQLVDKKGNVSRRVRDDYYEMNKENNCEVVSNYPGAGSVPKAAEGEQVAAGWPSWLASAAGEAVKGWIPLKADTFEKLDKIGQGTYSSVYKARDLTHNKVVALKRVRFDNMDSESVIFMAREILILRRLDHPNTIKLEGLVTSRTSSSIYLVFEYMEHDLTGLASLPGSKFSEPQVKCYMQQLLSGLEHCHSRGVLHRDIKGSNLLIDDNGILKIADFGLASFYDRHQKIPLTSRVVTLWYRPPELLLGATHYGVAVDLWSTGCILGELYARTPIMPGRTEVEQLHKIFKLCGSPSDDYWRKAKLPHSAVFKPQQPYKPRLAEIFKDLPAAAVGLMETLLNIDPACRGTAAAALKSEFFRTEPFACDPSSLPKYPPSKEIDAKLREEEAKRQGGLGVQSQRSDRDTRISKELLTVPKPDVKAELARPGQMRPGQSNARSHSEVFNRPRKHEAASGFLNDPHRPSQGFRETSKPMSGQPPERVSYSGPLGPGVGWTASSKKYEDMSFVSTRSDLSTLSGLVASRTLPSEDARDRHGYSHKETASQVKKSSELYEEPPRRQDYRRQMQNLSSSRHLESGRTTTKRPGMHGHPSSRNKYHFSGPLLGPNNKVDQMLKDQDRQIQEAARRARLERNRGLGKVSAEVAQITANNSVY